MNAELMAHGYSNFAAGAFFGLSNYMTYSNSLLFAKSKVRAIGGAEELKDHLTHFAGRNTSGRWESQLCKKMGACDQTRSLVALTAL
jgi:Sulfate permease family